VTRVGLRHAACKLPPHRPAGSALSNGEHSARKKRPANRLSKFHVSTVIPGNLFVGTGAPPPLSISSRRKADRRSGLWGTGPTNLGLRRQVTSRSALRLDPQISSIGICPRRRADKKRLWPARPRPRTAAPGTRRSKPHRRWPCGPVEHGFRMRTWPLDGNFGSASEPWCAPRWVGILQTGDEMSMTGPSQHGHLLVRYATNQLDPRTVPTEGKW